MVFVVWVDVSAKIVVFEQAFSVKCTWIGLNSFSSYLFLQENW